MPSPLGLRVRSASARCECCNMCSTLCCGRLLRQYFLTVLPKVAAAHEGTSTKAPAIFPWQNCGRAIYVSFAKMVARLLALQSLEHLLPMCVCAQTGYVVFPGDPAELLPSSVSIQTSGPFLYLLGRGTQRRLFEHDLAQPLQQPSVRPLDLRISLYESRLNGSQTFEKLLAFSALRPADEARTLCRMHVEGCGARGAEQRERLIRLATLLLKQALRDVHFCDLVCSNA